jgi:molecular chaperone DnaK (HSP70)
VIAHGGDLYLGGDDIDHALAGWAAEQVARELRWDLRADAVVFDRLVVECERAKIRLCYAQETRIELAHVDPAAPAADHAIAVDRSILARLTLDLVRRTFVVCDAVLREAGLRAAALDGVFLAGGTTLLPLVRKAVSQYFSRTPRTALDPMEVVGVGACVARRQMG